MDPGLKKDMKFRLKVEELEENKEELKEVAEDVFPIIVIAAIFCGLLLCVFLLRLYIRWSVTCPSKNRLDNKTVIITGANTGVGKATATELAKRGARLILGCRDRAKGDAVARLLRKKTGNQNVFASRLDLGSLESVKDFAEEFLQKESKLHVLINNAAYMGPKAATDDGFERNFGVNYLGHFYLTLLLMDRLRKCAPSRIVNVCSDAYTGGKIDFDDLALQKGYTAYGAYSRSKLAQVVFNMECHRHYFSSCVWSYAAHPGACCTDLMRNLPGMHGNVLRVLARVLFKSSDEGCQTVVYCAVADSLRDFSGKLFANCKVVKLNDTAKDKDLGRRLWNTSLTLTGLHAHLPLYGEGEEGEEGVGGSPLHAKNGGTQKAVPSESGDAAGEGEAVTKRSTTTVAPQIPPAATAAPAAKQS